MADLYTKVKKYLEDNEIDSSFTAKPPTSNYSLQDDGNGAYIRFWNADVIGVAKPTNEELNAFESSANTEETLNVILDNRRKEYPNHEDCIHALLDGGDTLTDLQTKRTAIKNKYPKE